METAKALCELPDWQVLLEQSDRRPATTLPAQGHPQGTPFPHFLCPDSHRPSEKAQPLLTVPREHVLLAQLTRKTVAPKT